MKFRSKFEKRFAINLKEQKLPFKYESEKIKYIVPETQRTYTPDFIISKKEGKKMYIETKGRLKDIDRKKLLLIRDQHPEIDLRLVFQNPKIKIRKGSKTTYGDWATKCGLKWATTDIPEKWIEECK